MFEPYTIECMTCGAHLRVEREEAIGEILACPQCQSMVQILPPGSEVEAEIATVASTEISTTGQQSTDSERSARANLPSSAGEKPDSTASLKRMPTPPSIKLPPWILLPVAASLGVLFALGVWSALRPPRETTKVEPEKVQQDDTADQRNSETFAPADTTATSNIEPERAATDTGSTEQITSPTDELPPVASDEQKREERKNPLRAEELSVKKQPAKEPLREQKTIDSSPRFPLPPATDTLRDKLKTQLQDIQFNQMPLKNALAVISDLSAIPIVLDHVSIIRTGLSPATHIHYQSKNGTIRTVLSELLAPLGLILVPSGDRVLVTVPDTANETFIDATYELGSASHAAAMAKVIRTVVAPASWEDAGGATLAIESNQLRISQTPAAQSAIRRLVTQLQDFKKGAVTKQTANLSTEDPLAQIVECGTREPLTLAAYLRQLSSRIDTDIVLDELELLRCGISNEQLIEVEHEKQSLGNLLDRTLPPLGLIPELMDDRTVIVTCDSGLEPALVLRIYPLPQNIRGRDEDFISTVRNQIAPHSWISGGGKGQIIVDQPSRTLIVLQQPSVQTEVANYLDGFSTE